MYSYTVFLCLYRHVKVCPCGKFLHAYEFLISLCSIFPSLVYFAHGSHPMESINYTSDSPTNFSITQF